MLKISTQIDMYIEDDVAEALYGKDGGTLDIVKASVDAHEFISSALQDGRTCLWYSGIHIKESNTERIHE